MFSSQLLFAKINQLLIRGDTLKICIIGAGSMGTALAQHLARNGHSVNLWVRRETLWKQMVETRRNADYFPQYELDPKISFFNKLDEAIGDSRLIIFAIPSRVVYEFIESNLPTFKNINTDDRIFLSAAKGLHYPPIKRVTEVISEFIPNGKVAVLSGPNIALEVLKGLPTTTTIACSNQEVLQELAGVFASSTLKVHTTTDVVGTELAGALKNVITIGIGLVDGLNLGENLKGVIVSEGFREIYRIVVSMGGDKTTLLSPAGIQDLLVASYSGKSRNYNLGKLMSQGYSMGKIVSQFGKITYEGYKIVKVAYELAHKFDISTPLIDAIYTFFYDKKSPQDVFQAFWHNYEVASYEI